MGVVCGVDFCFPTNINRHYSGRKSIFAVLYSVKTNKKRRHS